MATVNLAGIAKRAGTTVVSLQRLIEKGEGSESLAKRIGAGKGQITLFVAGTASPDIARVLGSSLPNAQGLRDTLGREGAIGLILGLACGISS